MPDHAPVGSIVNQVMDHFMSTPAWHSKAQQIDNKENDLTSVQQQHNITSENAEAALKEWILTRSGHFDWNLEEVTDIRLRNYDTGIPKQYLPDSRTLGCQI